MSKKSFHPAFVDICLSLSVSSLLKKHQSIKASLAGIVLEEPMHAIQIQRALTFKSFSGTMQNQLSGIIAKKAQGSASSRAYNLTVKDVLIFCLHDVIGSPVPLFLKGFWSLI